ncbi:MAG: transaldolase [Elusimicrobia bacterium RIFCSPLOWO2_01_FULL_60_11]|nr:MAG: transaldolase [Elusimicrobia bacterium RIFCSPLOWO2_01_FULL_60_11]
MKLLDLKIKIFADGANKDDMLAAYRAGSVDGFTTNPSLMRKAGVTDYEKFAKEVLSVIKDVSISFEVFSDEFDAMEREARKIASWARNIHVKIPVQNTKGQFSGPLIKKLHGEGIPLNVTAILTVDQVRKVAQNLRGDVPSIVSVFAGRIADTGVDPIPAMKECAAVLKPLPKCELLWASSREVLNIIQAEQCGCHIITVTQDIIKKLSMLGKNLAELSLDTVKMFFEDSTKSGFKI